MAIIFVNYDAEDNLLDITIRYNGKKTDHDRWEAWDMYQVLLSLGHRPIILTRPDGGRTEMMTY